MEYRGEQAVILESGTMRSAVLPLRGGKIASLQHLGEELLLQPPEGALPPCTPGIFDSSQSWGWDDMFPNIAPGPSPFCRNMHLPDHGEFWHLQASRVSHGPCSADMVFEGMILPYRIRKTVELHNRGIRVEWELTNLSPERLNFLWAAHPLLKVSPDCRLSGPGSYGSAEVINAYDNPGLPGFGRRYSFPEAHIPDARDGSCIRRLDCMHGREEGIALKYYFSRRITPRQLPLRIHQPSRGFDLEWTWDLGFLQYAGMWINSCGWGGQFTMAPEPSTSLMDSLEDAHEYGTAAFVEPNSRRCWWIELHLLIQPLGNKRTSPRGVRY